MTKKVSVLLAVVIFAICVLPIGSSAAHDVYYDLMSTEELAFCDLEDVPVRWQDEVLAARNEIIYSTSWTVDKAGYILHDNGTVEQLPEFADLFPNWELPLSTSSAVNSIATARSADYRGSVYLQNPGEDDSLPFYLFSSSASLVVMGMEECDFHGATWNGAFDNYSLGRVVTNAVNIATYDRLVMRNPYSGYSYGARASTYSTPGYALMYVEDSAEGGILH